MSLARLAEQQVTRIKAIAFVLCLYPLARLAVLGVTGGLGANPIEFITRSTGRWTLTFLLIALAATPLRRWTGWLWIMRLRRLLGLYAFFYAALHFLTYIWLDQFFDPMAIARDVLKRPFITLGFTCFLLLIPLAATSTDRMMRRLGGARWQLLHRFVYFIAIGGVVHYWWLVKKDITLPLAYGAVLALLLGARLAWYRRRNSLPAMARQMGRLG
ncbi:MAG: sulfoxide reductase heme-binding subunit YedZ [Betaproteobacteria bacterium]|nr:sulfoxide reductase heme-binding subunit YedZ [Betaproteobacteria bacterium]